MSSVNKVILVGRLGADPEIRNANNGKEVCNFSMATSERWIKEGQDQEKTEWHRVVVWGKLAEICAKYLHKGSQCYVEGKIQTRSWENDLGEKQYSTEIVALSVQFLSENRSQTDEDQGTNMEHIPF